MLSAFFRARFLNSEICKSKALEYLRPRFKSRGRKYFSFPNILCVYMCVCVCVCVCVCMCVCVSMHMCECLRAHLFNQTYSFYTWLIYTSFLILFWPILGPRIIYTWLNVDKLTLAKLKDYKSEIITYLNWHFFIEKRKLCTMTLCHSSIFRIKNMSKNATYLLDLFQFIL